MPGARVIGRILSLGFPLPGPLVDNYTFLSAPSFFDYNAIVVDLRALSLLIDGVLDGSVDAATFGGARVRARDAGHGEESLSTILLRRRDEAAMLLDNGGAIVCFASPPVTHAVPGTGDIDDVLWLPDDAAGACRAPALVPADGRKVRASDGQHPLATFVSSQAANIAYRARFDVAHIAGARVFARSEGGAALGVELPRERGRIALLPALAGTPAGDARYSMSDALQAGIRRLLGAMAEGREPAWLAGFSLPGLDERTAALDAARAARDDAQRALDAAAQARDELARYRRLLWQEGPLGLHDVVIEALRLLGFDVYANDPNAIEVRDGGVSALVEIEASEYPIAMAPHERLRDRVEDAFQRRSAAPRGVIFVNGRRLLSPAAREDEVIPALRLAAETMRYCVAPTSTLFAAVAATLAGDAEAAPAYRGLILTTDGVLPAGS
jgi:hypothetical protein